MKLGGPGRGVGLSLKRYAALEIQRELSHRNALLPESRKMQVRIGLNLGDVMEHGGALYGNGVTIAARPESLA